MSNFFDLLWLSVSPSLQHFDKPLLRYLSGHLTIAKWEFHQTLDEASSIDTAVTLLYDYLKHYPRQVHLAGHGMSGVVALMFARRYPKRVRSLTLLSVAAQPSNTWHAHYYVQRQMFTLSRDRILASNVRSLFGKQPPHLMHRYINVLDRDLDESPTLHSLFRLVNLPPGGVSVPMLVCGSQTDPVVSPPALHEWLKWFKTEDTLWECPAGYHFFHYYHPDQVGNKILQFHYQHHSLSQLTKSEIKMTELLDF